MVKTFKKYSFPEPKTDDLETWYAASGTRVLPSLFKWCPLTYFTVRSDLVPYAFAWEKGKTMDFLETIVTYDSKLAKDDRSDKKFLLTSKLCPPWTVCPLPHLYTCIKSWKRKLYKIRLQRHFFETCNKWVKRKGLSVDIKLLSPADCLSLPRGYIHELNLEKKMYKIRLQRYFFETCKKWMKWQNVSVDIKTWSPGGCLPLPRDYIHVKYLYKIWLQRGQSYFLKHATSDQSNKTFLLA